MNKLLALGFGAAMTATLVGCSVSGGDAIPPGGARTFTLSAGCWDVGGGEYAGGEAYERMTLSPGQVMRHTTYE